MPQEQTSSVTFVAGCAINRDMYYLASSPDAIRAEEDAPYTVMYFYQHQTSDKWFYHPLPNWRVMSVAFPEPAAGEVRKAYALSEQGEVECYSREGSVVERIPGAGLDFHEASLGYVHRIKTIANQLYVCGDEGQIYRKHEGWRAIGKELLLPALTIDENSRRSPEALPEFFSKFMRDRHSIIDIAGLDQSDIYVVGSDGFIAHFDGDVWTVLEKRTEESLNAIHIISKNEVWIVGSRGTVLRGSAHAGFDAVLRKKLDTDFYAVTSFQGSLYVSAGDGIYRVEATTGLERLKISDRANLSEVACIESKDGVLWAMSEKKLLRFDGDLWEQFDAP